MFEYKNIVILTGLGLLLSTGYLCRSWIYKMDKSVDKAVDEDHDEPLELSSFTDNNVDENNIKINEKIENETKPKVELVNTMGYFN